MTRQALLAAIGCYIFAAAGWVVWAGVVRDGGQAELLNVACDPTRELWRDVNARFAERCERHRAEVCRVADVHLVQRRRHLLASTSWARIAASNQSSERWPTRK